MADEYEINAKITADSSGFEKNIKKAQNTTKTFSKSITDLINRIGKNQLVTSLASLSLATEGVAKVFSSVNKIIKKTKEVINELTDSYKVQASAETALSTAIRNNPMMSDESFSELKKYASSLQKISTIGDEKLLPMMSKLISSGRTQEETQKIIKTALDLSASGMMDLDSAVNALNGTLNGNAGILGRQISGIKNLTEEELKNGKAIDIISKNFAGMSEAVAKATGTSEQLKNAVGDLKEEIGASFEKNLAPMRSFFTEMISHWADVKRARREAMEESEGIVSGTLPATNANIEKYRKQVTELQVEKNKLESQIRRTAQSMGYSTEEIQREIDASFELNNVIKQLKNARENLNNALDEQKRKEKELEEQRLNENQEELNKKLQAEIDARDKLRNEYDETIRQAKSEIEQKRKLGEEISEQEEAQQLLNVATSAYVKMMSSKAFEGNLGTYEHEVNARKQIAEWTEKATVEMQEELQVSKEESSWFDKVSSARIENLKIIRDKLVDFYKAQNLNESDIVKIKKKYNNEIYEIEWNRLNKEKEQELERLKNRKATESEILAIQEYYQLQFNILKQNNLAEQSKIEEEARKATELEEKKKLENRIALYNKFATTMQTIGNKIANVAKTIKNVFMKVINVSFDDLLDNLLMIEDKILTFFIETLPKIPGYVKAILESVVNLIATLASDENLIDNIVNVMVEISNVIVDNLGTILEGVITLISKLLSDNRFISSVIEIIIKVADILLDNFPLLFETVLKITTTIVIELIKKLPEILNLLLKALGTIVESLVMGIWEMLKTAWNSITSGFKSVGNWFKGLFGFATGVNNAPSGLALVGEQGPELIDFRGGERVYNAENTKRILSGGSSGGNSFNVTFNNLQDTSAYTMMNQLKNYQRQMAINGVL